VPDPDAEEKVAASGFELEITELHPSLTISGAFSRKHGRRV
jgi:hypothetical protein